MNGPPVTWHDVPGPDAHALRHLRILASGYHEDIRFDIEAAREYIDNGGFIGSDDAVQVVSEVDHYLGLLRTYFDDFIEAIDEAIEDVPSVTVPTHEPHGGI